MQVRTLALAVTAILSSAAVALGQTPTPTRVDSNVAVSPYAQSRGQTALRHCSASSTLCSLDTDCPSLQTCLPLGTPTPCTSAGAEGCGGCYPDALTAPNAILAALAQLPKVNPEWEPIGPMISGVDPSLPPDAALVRITGTIGLSKSPGDDFPGSHITSDYNAEIIPDDNSRLATGNTNDRVEFEWERDKLPMFAWAGEGDRLIAEGRWIFDCGHPDPGPLGKCATNTAVSCVLDSDCAGTCPGAPTGHCSNDSLTSCSVNSACNFGACNNPPPAFAYQSELHPPQASVMIRNKSLPAPHAGRTAPAIPATRADVYISADGGGAGDRCTVTHLVSPGDVLNAKACFTNRCSVTTQRSCRVDKDCAKGETCITLDPADRLANINAQNFEFDIPLPPPPVGPATLQIKTKSFKPKGGLMPKPLFTPNPPNLHVVVPMATPLPNGKLPNVFAESISAGWKEDTTSLSHVQVKLKSVTINNPLKESNTALPHVCANPNGGLLKNLPCATDKDCPATQACVNHPTKTCYSDADCPKKDWCTGFAKCLGGVVPGWEAWSQINGDWVQLKKLETIGAKAPFPAPPYVIPPTPVKIPQNFKFDEYVPPDGSIHLRVSGHSFDCLTTLFGNNLKDALHRYGLTDGATCLNAGTHGIGRVEVTHKGTDSPTFGVTTPLGKPTTFTVTSGGSCSVTDGFCHTAADCNHCSGDTSRFCSTAADCDTPQTCDTGSETCGDFGEGGTCSATTTRLCVTDNDCPIGACSMTSGACRAAGDCKHCSGNATQFCANTADCTSPQTCVSGSETCDNVETCEVTGGSFTLEYTVAIIP